MLFAVNNDFILEFYLSETDWNLDFCVSLRKREKNHKNTNYILSLHIMYIYSCLSEV